MQSVHSWGSPSREGKISIRCLTPAFSGAHKWAEMLRNAAFPRVPTKGNRIISGCLSPTLRGAHMYLQFAGGYLDL